MEVTYNASFGLEEVAALPDYQTLTDRAEMVTYTLSSTLARLVPLTQLTKRYHTLIPTRALDLCFIIPVSESETNPQLSDYQPDPFEAVFWDAN